MECVILSISQVSNRSIIRVNNNNINEILASQITSFLNNTVSSGKHKRLQNSVKFQINKVANCMFLTEQTAYRTKIFH